MAVSRELLDILVCPETKQPLEFASEALLAQLNARIRNGVLRNRGGGAVGAELEAGLLRQDGKVLYPVEGDIPVMLVEESLEIP